MMAGTPDVLLIDPFCSGWVSVWDDSLMLPGRGCPLDTDNQRTFVLRGAGRLGSSLLFTADLSSFTDVDPEAPGEQHPEWSRSDEFRVQAFYRLTGHLWVGAGIGCVGPFGGHGTQAAWHGLVGYENIIPTYEPTERSWGPVASAQWEEGDWFASAALAPWSAQASAGRTFRLGCHWSLGARGEAHYVKEDAPRAQRFGEKVENGIWASVTYARENLFLTVEINPVLMRGGMQLGWRF